MVNLADNRPTQVKAEAPFQYCKGLTLREILSYGRIIAENASGLSTKLVKGCEASLRVRLAP